MSETETPLPEVHLKELLDGLDNEELLKQWNETMEKAKEPIRLAYKQLPLYKRLKVHVPTGNSNKDDWQFGIIASMHMTKDPEEKVVFSCYCWSGEDETFVNHIFDMDQLDKLQVLETKDSFDKSVVALNLENRISLTEKKNN